MRNMTCEFLLFFFVVFYRIIHYSHHCERWVVFEWIILHIVFYFLIRATNIIPTIWIDPMLYDKRSIQSSLENWTFNVIICAMCAFHYSNGFYKAYHVHFSFFSFVCVFFYCVKTTAKQINNWCQCFHFP